MYKHSEFTRYLIVTKIIALVFLGSLAVRAEELGHFIVQGDINYNDFNNLEALNSYTKAYELDPESFEVLMKLTRACNDVGEDLKEEGSKEAERYFIDAFQYSEKMRELFPEKAETYFYLAATRGNLALFKGGKDKVKLGRYVESYAKKAIEINPDYAPAYVALGVFYREVANLNWFLKKFANAFFGGLPEGTNEDFLKALIKAEKYLPESVYVQFELGKTFKEIGNKEKMEYRFNKALKLPNTDHRDKYFKKHITKYLEE